MMLSYMTIEGIERALDSHHLWVRSRTGGKWYLVRRNGKTQRWKTQPGRFRIPVKVGFRQCLTITERERDADREYDWTPAPSDPNVAIAAVKTKGV